MPLVKLSKLLKDAEKGGYAVGYFESWDIYSFEAAIEAAEEENSPIVLGLNDAVSNQEWVDHFGILPLGAYGRAIAEQAGIPISFILSKVGEIDHIKKSFDAGFNAVMFDSQKMPFEDNIYITHKIVEIARPKNIEVLAELGNLADYNDNSDDTIINVDETVEFVNRTNIDLLAISIGNAHLKTEEVFKINIENLIKIRKKINIPLVIYGNGGFPDDTIARIIKAGVSMFHYGTTIKRSFFEELFKKLNEFNSLHPDYQELVGSRKDGDILMPAKKKMKELFKNQIKLYGSSNK